MGGDDIGGRPSSGEPPVIQVPLKAVVKGKGVIQRLRAGFRGTVGTVGPILIYSVDAIVVPRVEGKPQVRKGGCGLLIHCSRQGTRCGNTCGRRTVNGIVAEVAVRVLIPRHVNGVGGDVGKEGRRNNGGLL